MMKGNSAFATIMDSGATHFTWRGHSSEAEDGGFADFTTRSGGGCAHVDVAGDIQLHPIQGFFHWICCQWKEVVKGV